MNLTKWDPFKELEDMSQRLNRLFGRPVTQNEAGRDTLTSVARRAC